MIEEVLGIELTDNFKKITVKPQVEYELELEYHGKKFKISASKSHSDSLKFPMVIENGIINIKVE